MGDFFFVWKGPKKVKKKNLTVLEPFDLRYIVIPPHRRCDFSKKPPSWFKDYFHKPYGAPLRYADDPQDFELKDEQGFSIYQNFLMMDEVQSARFVRYLKKMRHWSKFRERFMYNKKNKQWQCWCSMGEHSILCVADDKKKVIVTGRNMLIEKSVVFFCYLLIKMIMGFFVLL